MLQVAVARLQKLFPISTSYPPGCGKINFRSLILVAGLATMLAYFVPFLLLGNNSYITIHDNLDGELVAKYLLVATAKGLIFDGSAPMEGCDTGYLRGKFGATFPEYS